MGHDYLQSVVPTAETVSGIQNHPVQTQYYQANPPWDNSSKSASSNDDDGITTSEGIGNIDDLVKGIETSFNNTPLKHKLKKEFHFHYYENEENDSHADIDVTSPSDDNSSINSNVTNTEMYGPLAQGSHQKYPMA
eukprot:scaffold289204_cov71-Attheya_sp.AAC.2